MKDAEPRSSAGAATRKAPVRTGASSVSPATKDDDVNKAPGGAGGQGTRADGRARSPDMPGEGPDFAAKAFAAATSSASALMLDSPAKICKTIFHSVRRRRRADRGGLPVVPPIMGARPACASLHLEKGRIYSLLQELLDANQPLAFVGVLKRMAELKAHQAVQGKITIEESLVWVRLADILDEVERTLRNDDPPNRYGPLAMS